MHRTLTLPGGRDDFTCHATRGESERGSVQRFVESVGTCAQEACLLCCVARFGLQLLRAKDIEVAESQRSVADRAEKRGKFAGLGTSGVLHADGVRRELNG